MKNAHPHTGKWLREAFPEQTKSIPSILIWSVIYILDVCLIFWIAGMLGIDLLSLHHQLTAAVVGVYLVAALILFWAQTSIYNRIIANYRKTLE